MDKLKQTLAAAIADETKAMESLAKASQNRAAAEKAIYDAAGDKLPEGPDREAAKKKALADALAEVHAPKSK
jgi:hypothetical protein